MNAERVQSQIWVVPAGKGKSIIHAALTYLFLHQTDYDIYVVFQHEGLLEVDKERNRKLQIYCDGARKKYSTRVMYKTDLVRKNFTKTCVMIIDESDDRMFKDMEAFYKATKSDKVITICLTATPYDGDANGLQAITLNELGYQIYHYSDKQEDYIPKIH